MDLSGHWWSRPVTRAAAAGCSGRRSSGWMRMSRPSRMTAIAPSAIRRRSVFIEQPRTAQVSASERSRSSPTGSVFVICGGAFVSQDAGAAHPAPRNAPAAGRARSARGAVRMRAPATGRPSPSSPSFRFRDGACLSPASLVAHRGRPSRASRCHGGTLAALDVTQWQDCAALVEALRWLLTPIFANGVLGPIILHAPGNLVRRHMMPTRIEALRRRQRRIERTRCLPTRAAHRHGRGIRNAR